MFNQHPHTRFSWQPAEAGVERTLAQPLSNWNHMRVQISTIRLSPINLRPRVSVTVNSYCGLCHTAIDNQSSNMHWLFNYCPSWEFPISTVFRTLPFHCGEPGFNSWLRNKYPVSHTVLEDKKTKTKYTHTQITKQMKTRIPNQTPNILKYIYTHIALQKTLTLVCIVAAPLYTGLC